MEEDQSYEEIEYETSKLIEEFCNVKIIEEHENGGVGKVCKAFEDERAEGRAEGITIGKSEGEDKLGILISKLISLGRTDDVSKAASDKSARAALYAEFGMND